MIPLALGRTDALKSAAAETGGMDPRLKPAAHDFEASMMQELLKPMEHDPLFSSSNGDGGGLGGGDVSMSSWSGLGVQSLARAISEAGGLGIATKVIAEVEAEAKQSQGAAQSAPVGGPGNGATSAIKTGSEAGAAKTHRPGEGMGSLAGAQGGGLS